MLCFHYSKSQCDASFTYAISGNQVIFYPSDSTSGKIHVWAFGDGDLGNNIIESHSYLPGTYTVSHVIEDAIANCKDSVVQTININYVPACNSFFSTNFYPPNKMIFRPHIYLHGTTLTTLNWTINGVPVASGGSISDFEYSFSTYGEQIIEMVATTSSGCISSYKDTIHSYQKCTLNTTFTYEASMINAQLVSFSPTPFNPALKYDWRLDSDSAFYLKNAFFSNQYEFPGSGDYAIKMFVIDSANHCFDSVTQIVPVALKCTVDFTSTQNALGQILFTPFGNQPTVKQEWRIYTLNGKDSILAFDDTPKTYIPIDTGSVLIALTVTTNTGCVAETSRQINIEATGSLSPKTIALFPNPTTSQVSFNIVSGKETIAKITVVNTMGSAVLQEQKKIHKGTNLVSLSVQQLSKGQYFIEIQHGDRVEKSVFNKL